MQIDSLRFTGDSLTKGLEVYCVGGAVRDSLLGLKIKDRDWVVVSATPDEMESRGFKPVGADFPVFIHPISGEEYALARTERKISKGYHGFSFFTGDVSLEEDLRRRDFTINAMAVDREGNLIDPFNGYKDLQDRVFRHVSDSFSEDPVRILRLGRFLARFDQFSVAQETIDLCRKMVGEGEIDALVQERVWRELSRALIENVPSKFFQIMEKVGAIKILFPNMQVPQKGDYLDRGRKHGFDLIRQYCVFTSYFPDFIAPQFAVPREYREYAKSLPLLYEILKDIQLQPQQILEAITIVDGLRKPSKFLALLEVVNLLLENEGPLSHAQWAEIIQLVITVPTADLINLSPLQIKEHVQNSRLQIIQDYIDDLKA